MTEHDNQPHAIALRGEFDAADLGRGNDIAGDTDHEQIAQTLVEDDLRRHPRIRAAENDRERFLPRRHLVAAGMARERAAIANVGYETLITLLQARKSFSCRDHRWVMVD